MKITWNELTIPLQGLDFDALLTQWRWLVPEDLQPVLLSAVGDLFLVDVDGGVHWLDAGVGQLSQVAASVSEFQQAMQQTENANMWFLPQLIGDLIESGVVLQPGQCYSCDVPPGLGGQFSIDNVAPTDLHVHFSMFGQIFAQTKDLPAGTKLDGIRFVDESDE